MHKDPFDKPPTQEPTPAPAAAEVARAAGDAHANRGHHPFGPSGLGALRESPCFRNRNFTSAASLAGTAQHEAVETGEADDLDDEQADAVDRARRMVAATRALIENAGFTVYSVREQYVRVDDETVIDDAGREWKGTTGGFPDEILLHEDTDGSWKAYGFDWKFGRIAVEPAVTNLQGKAYVLGAVHLMRRGELIPGKQGEIKWAQMVFFSPHRNDQPTDAVFEYAQFAGMLDEVRTVVRVAQTTREAAKQAGGIGKVRHLLRPSVKTCQFCAHLADCPAVADLALKVASRYAPMDVPEDVIGATELDPEKVGIALKVAATVKQWAEAYRKRRTDLAFDDPDKHLPKGYKLVASYPIRIKDPVALVAHLKERFGEEFVMAHVEVPITPFDLKIKADAPRGQKTAAVDEFRKFLSDAGIAEPSPLPSVSLRME